jgi:hypothetical protein
MVSPAEATTSATGSLTSGGYHLSTDDSGHLCTGGWWLPQHTRRGPRSRPHYGSEDKTNQERGRRPRDVRCLVRPPPPVRPPAWEKPWMRRTCARCDRRPCGGRAATAPTKRQEAASEAAPRPSKPGNRARGGRRRLQSAGPAYPKFASSARLVNALLPRMLEEEAGR